MRASHYLPLALQLLKSAAGLGALCWGVGVLLTYSGAHSFAVAAGYGDTRAWLFPLTLDAVALVAYLALLMLPAGDRWYPLLVVVLCAGASAAAQGYHQAGLRPGSADLQLAGWVAFLAGAWPAVAALLSGHLVWMIVQRAIPAGLVSALRSLAEVDQADIAAEHAAVSAPAQVVVSPRPVRRAVAVSPARVHVPPAVRADVPPEDTDGDAGPEPLRSVPDTPVRTVGQVVPVDDALLARVRSGELTQKAAAKLAGCHPKTIGRRLTGAA